MTRRVGSSTYLEVRLRKLKVIVFSLSLGAMSVFGISGTASASCTEVDPEIGCLEDAACEVGRKIFRNCVE